MEITGIRHVLEDCRQEALTEKFMPQFMELLLSQGFTVIDLLDALACWVQDKPEYANALVYLEGAIDVIKSNKV
jgi:hypothetical protein